MLQGGHIMSTLSSLKTDLLSAINEAQPDGTYSDDVYEKIKSAIDELVPHSPIPRPFSQQEDVAGHWITRFAQFGPRHTAGKPIEHENQLNYVSFSAFPAVPFRNLELSQEIHQDSKDYNNVHVIQPSGGGPNLRLATYGRYHVTEEEPQRYGVEFYKTRVWSEEGHSDDEVRSLLNLPDDHDLECSVKSPKLHSDIVFCDDTLRINFGSVGGIYVLERQSHPGVTVSFA